MTTAVNGNIKDGQLEKGIICQEDPLCKNATLTKEFQNAEEELRHRASRWCCDVNSLTFAMKMDAMDPLRSFRNKFHYPKSADLPGIDSDLIANDEESVYLCGNSLGLLPKTVKHYVDNELEKWAAIGVHGHRHGELPWAFCDEKLRNQMAPLVGAKPEEIGLENGLTVNLHLLMISFYQPTKTRHKILIEGKAFPSDHYVVESQIRLHGLDPKDSLICVSPREGEHCLRIEDILKVIKDEGENIAVVLFPGVQYYTGQYFDISSITEAAHEKGCWVGLDLAHAVGNVEIKLHDWDVDFAAWCSYKYLNSGAGGIAGIFLHEKHKVNNFPRLQGWWGHKIETRFQMNNVMEESQGVDAYRISNPSMFMCAALKGSLEVFSETSMSQLTAKSRLLTGYLEMLLHLRFPVPEDKAGSKSVVWVEVITPKAESERGAQLSVSFSVPIQTVFVELQRRGVVCDKREPNVLRFAPAPLYNSFRDVHRFLQLLEDSLEVAILS